MFTFELNLTNDLFKVAYFYLFLFLFFIPVRLTNYSL